MSGVTGAGEITKKQFKEILDVYIKELNNLGIYDIKVSGSYVSNPKKQTFGDIDLIIAIPGDKKTVKKELAKKLINLPGIQKFTGKYEGRKYYNSGEIITVRYRGAQIDNIIASTPQEAIFKYNFLNLPAEVQGLVLGAVKVYKKSSKNGIVHEYNLSSKYLSLREITLVEGKEIRKNRKILKTWTDWDKVVKIADPDDFETMITRMKKLPYRERGRIKGIFNSMVSVKSGEIGKPKGNHKTWCLNKVNQEL